MATGLPWKDEYLEDRLLDLRERLDAANTRAAASDALAREALRLLAETPGRRRQGFALSYPTWNAQVDALLARGAEGDGDAES